jgi:hypothetical protein
MKHIENIAELFSKNFMESPVLDSFDAGKIHLSSGKLISCDPILTNDMQPFSTIFPQGDFPIVIHQEKDSQLVAYVEIIFSDQPCDSWQMAITEGQKMEELKKNEIFGFPVASGMAAFMDAETQIELNLLEEKLYLEKQENFRGIYDEFFHDAFFDGEKMVKNYALLQPNIENTNSIFALATPETEGFFASYIGINKDKNPVKIVMELIEIGGQ